MRALIFPFVVIASVGCTSNPATSDNWQRFSVDLSGHAISFSSPPGSSSGTYLPAVDLVQNKEDYVTLFKRSWIFGGLVGDSGALELIIALNRGPVGNTEEELIQGIQKHVSAAYDDISKEPTILQNVKRRQFGGKQWVCYDKSVFGTECARRIDASNYLTWRLKDINNRGSQINARNELRAKIEESVEVAF